MCIRDSSVPFHHAGDFTGKHNSLHAFVFKREFSEKGLPDLLSAQRLGRAVGRENLQGVGERRPKILKTAIEDVFNRVAVVLIHVHPSKFFCIVYREILRGDQLAGVFGARQKPLELDSKDQEETVDVARNVFMYLDTAIFKRVLGGKITLAPAGTVTVVIAVSLAARMKCGAITWAQCMRVAAVKAPAYSWAQVRLWPWAVCVQCARDCPGGAHWRRRLDGIGLDTVTKEFLAIEFKQTQDARRNYMEKATAVAQDEYTSLLTGLQAVGQVKG